ncbi:fibrinogen C domain-containing protein 1 isoform X4 [Drosophila ficusphila]|uniref:fibrinogen C domain-containing protein 1 isoform X4 n=2 Tax=Drosophila ficusphila TaxID=30025 RepID=UPI001C8A51A3|nr:fibrinogen C domain-containing protein 1 isoform X4 [Drosophila ficusphila]
MMPKLGALALVFMAAICGFATGSVVEVPGVTQAPPPPPPPRYAQINQTRSRRPSNFRVLPGPPTFPPSCDFKELMANLQDRVSVLVTLDQDQRHRLEVIDKKLDQLVESSAARMESMKAQQLDFQQRLDSFEHIQRLSRSTLDELKDLSRNTRDVPQDQATGSEVSVPNRLDALATLLVSTNVKIRALQIEVGNLTRTLRRQSHLIRSKGFESGRPDFFQTPGPHGSPAGRPLPTSCAEEPLISQFLRIQLKPQWEPFYVQCAEEWTVVLSRSSDDVSFERGWLDYRDGFGNLAGDFFIGLNKLHALTSSSLQELRIVLEDSSGTEFYAGYAPFAIGSEPELFPLSLLGRFQDDLQPNAGDSLFYHAGAKFSTLDQDNDNCVDCSCATKHKGAGWFNNCATTNLFGRYLAPNEKDAGETGMWWETLGGRNSSLKKVRWMIKPVGEGSDFLRR